jgi:hypothetical protein
MEKMENCSWGEKSNQEKSVKYQAREASMTNELNSGEKKKKMISGQINCFHLSCENHLLSFSVVRSVILVPDFRV